MLCLVYHSKEKKLPRRKKLSEHVKWMKPDTKASYLTIPFIWNSRKGKTTLTESRKAAGIERWTAKGHERNHGGDGNTLHFDCDSDGYTTNIKTYQTIHFNFNLMNSITCNLYLNKVHLKNQKEWLEVI